MIVMKDAKSETARNRNGPGHISTMTSEELSKIEQFVWSTNNTNKSVKIFPNIQDGVLLSITVRFMAVSKDFSSTIADGVFDTIEALSRRRVLPMRDERWLKNGILEMKVSYVNRRCGAKNIIESLEFVANNLIDTLLEKHPS